MKCTICGKEIRLHPSAKERARQDGGAASDYTKIFTTHSECFINKRNEETVALMRQQKAT